MYKYGYIESLYWSRLFCLCCVAIFFENDSIPVEYAPHSISESLQVQERQLVTISSDIVSKVMLKAREILNNSIDVQVSSDAKASFWDIIRLWVF